MLKIHDVKVGDIVALNDTVYNACSGIIAGSIETGDACLGGGECGSILVGAPVRIVAIADHRSGGKCDVFGEFKALVEAPSGLRTWASAWQIVKS